MKNKVHTDGYKLGVLDNKVHADDVGRVSSVTVKHHGGPCLEPHKLPTFRNHSVVAAHPLPSSLDCQERVKTKDTKWAWTVRKRKLKIDVCC